MKGTVIKAAKFMLKNPELVTVTAAFSGFCHRKISESVADFLIKAQADTIRDEIVAENGGKFPSDPAIIDKALESISSLCTQAAQIAGMDATTYTGMLKLELESGN